MKVVRSFYTDLEKAVMDTVCLNYNTDASKVLDAIVDQFGNSDMIEDIVRMAEEMLEEINNDLSEFNEDEVYTH
jgi:nitrogen regulatory protein PII-like uncharacterized protein